MFRKILALMAVLMLASTAFAVLQKGEMKLYAVTNNGDALTADLLLEVEPGDGKIYTELSSIVGASTQDAERKAVSVARRYSENVDKYDFKFHIITDAAKVEGPSAGAAMTLLVISLLTDRPIPDDVGITGTITSEGFVGSVGGIFAKSKKASQIGKKLFMIPAGEAKQIERIDGKIQTIYLPEYAMRKWGLKVVEVNTIDEVIEYAFADISSVDVNSDFDKAEFDSFTPAAVDKRIELDPMGEINQRYLELGTELSKKADRALDGAIIDDHEIFDYLVRSKYKADEFLSKAELLYANNYYYSSANFSFLAIVSLNTVLDIAENPSILSPDSTALQAKVKALDAELDELENELGKDIPTEGIEWLLSAKQRFSYARQKVDSLFDKTPEENKLIGLFLVEEYQSAKAWTMVSKDLLAAKPDTNKMVSFDNVLDSFIDDFTLQVENHLEYLEANQADDVSRRITASRLERDLNWPLVSLYDAASALGLAEAKSLKEHLKEESLDDFFYLIEEEIRELDSNMAMTSKEYIWSRLYMDHANYYLKTAYHSDEIGQASNARANLENALELTIMARRIFWVMENTYLYIDGLDEQEFIVKNGIEQETVVGTSVVHEERNMLPDLLLVMVGIISGALLMFVVLNVFYVRFVEPSHETIQYRIQQNKKEQKKLDIGYAKNRISLEKYDSKKETLLKKLSRLNKERRSFAAKLLELDKDELEMYSVAQFIRDLKRRRKEGLLTENEYKRKAAKWKSKLRKVRLEVDHDKKALSKTKKKKPIRRSLAKSKKLSRKKESDKKKKK